MQDEAVDDRVAEAVQLLYAGTPDDFLTRRTELADAARQAGDNDAAKQIAALRKPTLAAAIVNQFVHDRPDVVERLGDLGARLRAAQETFDAALLRELSGERRGLVQTLTRQAWATPSGSGTRHTPALRDEVTATIDAAIADPGVTARLGRLTCAEHWSGFGFDIGAAPNLKLVQGGKSAPAKPAAPPARKPSPAELRRIRAAIDRAQDAYDRLDADYAEIQRFERQAIADVRSATEELAAAERNLAEAKRSLDEIRSQVREKRRYHREARLALDRAMRQAPPAD